MRRWNSAHVQESSRICAGCSRRRRSSRRSVEEDSPSQHPRRDPCRMHVARMRTDRRAAAIPTVFIQVSACDAHHRAFARISHLSQRHEPRGACTKRTPQFFLFVCLRASSSNVCVYIIYTFFSPRPVSSHSYTYEYRRAAAENMSANNNYKRQYDKYVRHGTRTVH